MKQGMRLLFLIILIPSLSFAQTKREKVPSYFGFQIKPVFPTRFIGEPKVSMEKEGFFTDIEQGLGYSFGATVRAGITKLIAFDTGINYTQRNFFIDMGIPDSMSFARDTMTLIEYDFPINGLIYIQLSEKWFMNTSLGLNLTFKPTDVRVTNTPGGYHSYNHIGLVQRRISLDLNAAVGFEFRTEKSGFFYLGGYARVPFAPAFTLLANYAYQGNSIHMNEDIDGSFLAIEFKYFFPNIANKGPQFNKGPIE